MKGTGHRLTGGTEGYRGDDWEVSEELSPDPFSEEEHSKIHGRRFSDSNRRAKSKNSDISQNQEKNEDNLV